MKELVKEIVYIRKGVRIEKDFILQLKSIVERTWKGSNITIVAIFGNARIEFSNDVEFTDESDLISDYISGLEIHVTKTKTDHSWDKNYIELAFSCNIDDTLEAAIIKRLSIHDVSEYNSLNNEICELLKKYRLNFWIIASYPIIPILGVIFLFCFTFLNMCIMHLNVTVTFMVYIITINIMIGSGYKVFRKLKGFLFPKNEIYFGVNKRRIDNGINARYIIFVTVIMGIVIGIISGFATNTITGFFK